MSPERGSARRTAGRVAPQSRSRLPTREKILRCAERLFAREGVDRVTVREIARAARQRNVAAVQYHFGSKEKLLAEIIDRHQDAIDARRRELLDEGERAGQLHDLPSLLRVLVQPLAEALDDPGGRAYLQIQAQGVAADGMRPATRVMVERTARALGGDPDPVRDRLAVLLLFAALADRARAEETGTAAAGERGERARFVASLTDAIHALYLGPPR